MNRYVAKLNVYCCDQWCGSLKEVTKADSPKQAWGEIYNHVLKELEVGDSIGVWLQGEMTENGKEHYPIDHQYVA